MFCFEDTELRLGLSGGLVFECINCESHLSFTVVEEVVMDLKLVKLCLCCLIIHTVRGYERSKWI
jgi:hypothetical protein